MNAPITDIKVIAFDPGVTTGFAQGTISDGLMTITSGQDEMGHKHLWSALQLVKPDIIVHESFEFRRNARDNLILFSVELIGILNLYAQQFGCTIKSQTASQGKGHFSDDKLKLARVYRTGKPHANDAIRHLLQWYQFGPGYQYNTRGYESGA